MVCKCQPISATKKSSRVAGGEQLLECVNNEMLLIAIKLRLNKNLGPGDATSPAAAAEGRTSGSGHVNTR